MAWVNQTGEKFGGHPEMPFPRWNWRQEQTEATWKFFVLLQNLRWKGVQISRFLFDNRKTIFKISCLKYPSLKNTSFVLVGAFLGARWKCELTSSFFSPARPKKRHAFSPKQLAFLKSSFFSENFHPPTKETTYQILPFFSLSLEKPCLFFVSKKKKTSRRCDVFSEPPPKKNGTKPPPLFPSRKRLVPSALTWSGSRCILPAWWSPTMQMPRLSFWPPRMGQVAGLALGGRWVPLALVDGGWLLLFKMRKVGRKVELCFF